MGGAKGIKGKKDDNSEARIYGNNCVLRRPSTSWVFEICVVHRPRRFYASPARPRSTGDVCPIQGSFGALNFV
jgi:hypothetical protein